MTVFLPILVCLCGGVGASCRYLLDATIKTYWQRAFPLSTFTINLIAGFLTGLVAALAGHLMNRGGWCWPPVSSADSPRSRPRSTKW